MIDIGDEQQIDNLLQLSGVSRIILPYKIILKFKNENADFSQKYFPHIYVKKIIK